MTLNLPLPLVLAFACALAFVQLEAPLEVTRASAWNPPTGVLQSLPAVVAEGTASGRIACTTAGVNVALPTRFAGSKIVFYQFTSSVVYLYGSHASSVASPNVIADGVPICNDSSSCAAGFVMPAGGDGFVKCAGASGTVSLKFFAIQEG